MKKLCALVVLLCLVWSFVPLPASAEDKPAPKVVKKAGKRHHRGRKAPKNLAALMKLKRLKHEDMIKRLPKATAPTYDCRTLGIVPPVVDQGQCGSCWDFSGTSICTSALMKALGTAAPGPLSEQYTLDCGQNGGCDGDDNTTVTAWAKTTGLPTTAAYGAYAGAAGKCGYQTTMTLYKIADWGFVDNQGQGVALTQDIKNAIVAFGPVGTGVAAGNDWDDVGPATILSGTSTDIDHDVVIVGWDDTKGKNGVWVVRNSWGTDWGNVGYVYMEYGADSIGTEAIWVTAAAPPVPPAPPDPPAPVPPTPTPPTPPTPVPPSPTETITITTSADLPAGSYTVVPSGSVVITGDMTISQLMLALETVAHKAKRKKQDAPKKPMTSADPVQSKEPPKVSANVERAIKKFMSAYDEAGGGRDLRLNGR
jgi:hypothetical protein